MTRARVLAALAACACTLLAGLPSASAGGGTAVPEASVRPAGEPGFAASARAEQQGGLTVTFIVRVENTGNTTVSFTVDGERGGAAFGVRYLEGAFGDRWITARVVAGTYVLEHVPPGGVRRLRIRVRVDADAPIDRTGLWRLEISTPEATDEVTAEVRSVTRAFARAAGVLLRVPAAQALGITFHQSLFDRAAALRPIGRLLENDHPSYDPPPDSAGPGYIVMEPRGRGTPATSASDDVLARGEPVLAPVTGRVMRVTTYRLYCRWSDIRIAIRPADAPGRAVQIFHVEDPRVERGDRVRVSHTVIGLARRFPFRSQTQDYGLGGRHLHLEIERDGSTPLPGCGVGMPRAGAGAGAADV